MTQVKEKRAEKRLFLYGSSRAQRSHSDRGDAEDAEIIISSICEVIVCVVQRSLWVKDPAGRKNTGRRRRSGR